MNIDITILSAIIALSGVIISVLISFASTRLNIQNEIAKLETSIVQNYSSKIMEERNNRYPEVYFELSQMAKKVVTHKYKIGRTKIDINAIQDFVFKLDELDSKNCVFFSSLTGNASSKLRLFTYQLIYDSLQSEKDFETILNEDKGKEFLEAIGRLEIALKKDLGIFIIEFQDPKNKTSTMSYSELQTLREQLHNPQNVTKNR